MTLSKQARIWVVDPGLMEAGGHHAALAETLCQYYRHHKDNHNINFDVSVLAHQLFDNGLKTQLEESGLTVSRHFASLFYKYFHDGVTLGPAGVQEYVRQLCSEYQLALDEAITQSLENRIVLFFPCLNWEHAWALDMAIARCGQSIVQADLHMVCCAMYSPTQTTKLSNQKMWFRMGFQRLISHPFLSLYASEYELCQAYQDLINCDAIENHPCYLMDWSSLRNQSTNKHAVDIPGNTVLLYLGDAKEDKGFNRLPEVLKSALANSSKDTHFLIQFTLAWAYPELSDCISQLKAWAETEPRLILHHGFWSNDQLAQVMMRISLAVCTYDTNVYQNKSSGLVWMLAFFDRPFIIDAPCWLTREAQRLGVRYQVSPDLALLNIQDDSSNIKTNVESYKETMFEPLFSWLVNH
ncbi:hypothetical protein [Aliiglaciecola litoralis]|uniref:Glycosyltransferase family 1 protein n=1 Tax=Aliiglaciecola litoralis TaxID=582857 RepID=A0ABN1LJK8_9ALTE